MARREGVTAGGARAGNATITGTQAPARWLSTNGESFPNVEPDETFLPSGRLNGQQNDFLRDLLTRRKCFLSKSFLQLMNRLRVLRAERRLSQLDTALSAGIGATRSWKIENDYVQPTDVEREALVRVFGVSLDQIFPDGDIPAA